MGEAKNGLATSTKRLIVSVAVATVLVWGCSAVLLLLEGDARVVADPASQIAVTAVSAIVSWALSRKIPDSGCDSLTLSMRGSNSKRLLALVLIVLGYGVVSLAGRAASAGSAVNTLFDWLRIVALDLLVFGYGVSSAPEK